MLPSTTQVTPICSSGRRAAITSWDSPKLYWHEFFSREDVFYSRNLMVLLLPSLIVLSDLCCIIWHAKYSSCLVLIIPSIQGVVGSGLMVAFQAWCVRLKGPLYVSAFTPLKLIWVALAGSLILDEKIHMGRYVTIDDVPAIYNIFIHGYWLII